MVSVVSFWLIATTTRMIRRRLQAHMLPLRRGDRRVRVVSHGWSLKNANAIGNASCVGETSSAVRTRKAGVPNSPSVTSAKSNCLGGPKSGPRRGHQLARILAAIAGSCASTNLAMYSRHAIRPARKYTCGAGWSRDVSCCSEESTGSAGWESLAMGIPQIKNYDGFYARGHDGRLLAPSYRSDRLG